ncbi:ankyrin repeat-containing domain protein [Fomitopsis betulina]|nr:ankyrin repeat-containing domain protein [Fomitopsis betulina]
MAQDAAHNAALSRQTGLLRSLVSQDPTLVNAPDVDGRTPLHWAASSGALDIVRYLIDHKADVDSTDNSGWTPLQIAGHEDVVRELLGAGANVNHKNDKGITPLLASYSSLEELTSMHATKRTNYHWSTGFISLLLSPPEGSPKTRLNTADRVALESAHAEAACLLIEAGADRTRENLDGEMPEDLEGVGGQEQRRARAYVIERCGKRS